MIDSAQDGESGPRFSVKFWGVRGSMPTPGPRTVRYGGHTSCVEIRCDDHLLIFDAGSGLFSLGESLKNTNEMDVFLSHTHLDHILGFPFFTPAHKKDNRIRVWAGHLKAEGRNVKEALAQLMSPPLFPLTPDSFRADISYYDFLAGESPPCAHLKAAGIDIQTLPLNHPDRATGYRVNFRGHSACYITDVEHRDHQLDIALLEFIKGCDVLIYDSTYDDREFDRYQGWGHSTWQHAVRLADAAQVKTLTLFHHDYNCSDDDLDRRGEELEALRPDDQIAREGMVIRLV
jgi:phosphoribosyl 1,2-cyclic phosphodiesterase